jgi:glycosyltransferase involved in cell wall biosynthesis
LKKIRVIGFVVNLVPYLHARWQAFAKDTTFETHLIEITSRDHFEVLGMKEALDTAYQRHVLFPEAIFEKISQSALSEKVSSVLQKLKPDVVCLNGYWAADSWAGLLWCQENGVPALVFSESNSFDYPRKAWKEWIKRKIVSQFSAGLAGGSPQKEYLISLGLSPDSVFTGYDAVDNDFFSLQAEKIRGASQNTPLLPQNFFLACARFEEKKNLPGLIRAYAIYQKQSAPDLCWHLVIVGDGSLRSRLDRLISDLSLDSFVHLPGAQPIEMLPQFYARAKALVHASTTEQWGLVVNEALASALPVLVSTRCGCATDLVRNGVNGFIFDPENPETLGSLFQRISCGELDLKAMGEAGAKIIADWGPERFAEGLRSAVGKALQTGPSPGGVLSRVLLRLLLFK